MIETADKTFSFAGFELDTVTRRLLKNGENVPLNPKAFDLLFVLVAHHGQILSKGELLDEVWEGQFVEENNLTVHISALRKIFGEQKGENRFILTVPGKGYKFIAELNEPANAEIIIENHKIERITVDQIETAGAAAERLPFGRKNYVPALAVTGLLAVIGAVAVWFFLDRFAAGAAPIESIAVMPFVYEGGNAETEYLSDGMTESLINNLSQLPKLTVKARASVFQYKGKEFNANKIGSDLTVQAILLGRITERGDALKISLELIDARTDNHLWGEQYTRKKSDLAVLQTEIARDVSAKLRQKLSNVEPLQKGQTANAEAYRLYLKGRYLWNKRRHEEHLKALAAFEQALALDPNFALAYAAIGDVYTVDSFHGTEAEKNAKGRAAAEKALEIEPNLAEALTVLAKIESISLRRTESEKYYKRALELNPNYASAHQWYAEFLMQDARIEESIFEIERALELDPLSSIINSDAAYIYTMGRQEDKAIAQANKLLEFDATWQFAYEWRAAAYEAQGNYAAAIADFEKNIGFSYRPDERKAQHLNELKELKEAFEKSGERGYWEKSLEITKRSPDPDCYFLAVCYVKLGDRENALSSLEKMLENNQASKHKTKAEPYFDSLRSEPRFQAILRRLNLEP